jgi:hypothetical protein
MRASLTTVSYSYGHMIYISVYSSVLELVVLLPVLVLLVLVLYLCQQYYYSTSTGKGTVIVPLSLLLSASWY